MVFRAIALNLEEDNVGVVLMGETGDIKEGAKVRRTGQIASIKVGEGMVGRVVNTLGEPIDGKGPITANVMKCHWSVKRRVLFSVSR